MPLLEETADLSRLSTGGKRDMSGRGAGTITTNTSVPASVSVTPDNVVAAIEAAQNTEINVTPQRKVLPETPLTPPKLPKTPPKPTPQLGQGVDFFGNDNVRICYKYIFSKYRSCFSIKTKHCSKRCKR